MAERERPRETESMFVRERGEKEGEKWKTEGQRERRRERERERERVHERIEKESGTGSSIILIQTPLLGP